MKATMTMLATGILALGLSAFGQQAQESPAQGRGRGGAPHAWNDKDKDGICDVTGKPVGQGRGQMAGRGRCGGRGQGAAARGRGMGRGPAANTPAAPQAK